MGRAERCCTPPTKTQVAVTDDTFTHALLSDSRLPAPGQGNGQNPGTPGNPVTPAKPGVAGQPGSSVGGGLANTGADGWLTLLPLSLILLIGGLGGLLLVDIRRKRLSE